MITRIAIIALAGGLLIAGCGSDPSAGDQPKIPKLDRGKTIDPGDDFREVRMFCDGPDAVYVVSSGGGVAVRPDSPQCADNGTLTQPQVTPSPIATPS